MTFNKNKIISVLILTIASSIMLTGCWQRAELNETAFVIGMGIDKAEKGFKVTLQVVIPSSIASQATGGSGGGVPIQTTTQTVPTIYETQRKYSLGNSRNVYYGHIRVLVIGEALARDGIGETLDVFIRSREPRSDFYVMVAKETTAENVLKILTPVNKLPANKLFESLDKSHKLSAKTAAVPLNRFIEDFINRGISPVLTGVKVIGNVEEGGSEDNLKHSTPPTETMYDNVAVFRKDKMVGWLDDVQTIGYNYITDNVVNSSGIVKGADGNPIVIEAIKTKTKKSVKMEKGEPHIYVEVKALCNVQEVMSSDNLEEEKVIKELEKKSAEKIIERMQTAVTQINDKFNVDIFGFGRTIYQSKPKEWRKLLNKYGHNYLKQLPIHYNAKVIINRIGLVDKTFILDVKE
ncbi:spore germination protein KC [Paenibacillus turicensis]|uniref:Spore germination protein KC n=1 Tax=Paenibacillus turicensis TaxID=160487 RepID=A0ABS4FMZ4_9BACL|nr:Ger(x)C family spore germination protein [Paenibacillus turicensis]MBP1903950.1 spore germination protein KC [Paenibacillus turicensis]